VFSGKENAGRFRIWSRGTSKLQILILYVTGKKNNKYL